MIFYYNLERTTPSTTDSGLKLIKLGRLILPPQADIPTFCLSISQHIFMMPTPSTSWDLNKWLPEHQPLLCKRWSLQFSSIYPQCKPATRTWKHVLKMLPWSLDQSFPSSQGRGSILSPDQFPFVLINVTQHRLVRRCLLTSDYSCFESLTP